MLPPVSLLAPKLATRLRQDGDCIVWTGALRDNGYGVMGGLHDGVTWYESAHRLAYLLTFGPIPAGLHVDHLCRNRACVNPDHLEAVTQAENNRRANALRWHGVAGEQPIGSTTLDSFRTLLLTKAAS